MGFYIMLNMSKMCMHVCIYLWCSRERTLYFRKREMMVFQGDGNLLPEKEVWPFFCLHSLGPIASLECSIFLCMAYILCFLSCPWSAELQTL